MILHRKNLLVVGAGEAGTILLEVIEGNPIFQYNIVGFVDDDPVKLSGNIRGIPIVGTTRDIPNLVAEKKIDEIIIAIPSLDPEKLKNIVEICETAGAEVKILPSNYEALRTWKTGRPSVKPIREISMEDLLKRKPILIEFSEIKEYLSNKNVLVTGAGGSIGSELCRQISELNPNTLVLFDNSEYNLYEIERELKKRYSGRTNIKTIIGDVKERVSLDKVFKQFPIDVVFHAAAYKHVPLMEFNISEAIKNNILGTYNLCLAANKNKVKSFVLISTDKAVNPSSVMGSTKRVCEMVTRLFDDDARFIIVRFGNVIGSRGSVIPLFKEQIDLGGPVTITHPGITRYFMTIPEASQLVIQAGAIGKNGDIMILDMGEPYKIEEIAKDLIKLHGLVPFKDIKIEYIGLRPGEKLHEELMTKKEDLTTTKNERIFIGKSENFNKEKFNEKLCGLLRDVDMLSEEELKTKLQNIISQDD